MDGAVHGKDDVWPADRKTIKILERPRPSDPKSSHPCAQPHDHRRHY